MKQVLSMRGTTRRFPGSQRGAVLVEFAIILPFLALIFLTIVDFGLVLREHQILVNAAREGARFSSLPKNWVASQNPGASISAIQQHVVDYCAEEGITIATTDVTVNQNASFNVAGITVQASEVTVFVNRQLLVPATLFFGSGSVDLRGHAVIRNFYGN